MRARKPPCNEIVRAKDRPELFQCQHDGTRRRIGDAQTAAEVVERIAKGIEGGDHIVLKTRDRKQFRKRAQVFRVDVSPPIEIGSRKLGMPLPRESSLPLCSPVVGPNVRREIS